ncbi:lytic transglycosylase domain-containing protein [Microbacterium album]|uniref:lytic transglycosylase domain-containing protein n=1 Tax=Microbacterium album TaxID=2053191 RepID=UPI001E32CB0A|nr:lytic murein transglycosylase [Microbacterium album]
MIAVLVVGAGVLVQHTGLDVPERAAAAMVPLTGGAPVATDVTVAGTTGASADAGASNATGTPAAASSAVSRIDPEWAAGMAAATGIPERALVAYAAAHLTVSAEQPSCGIGWNTLAGIGRIESGHGSHGGAVVGEDGWVLPRILGVPLDGNGVMAIRDTDGGAWDGDTVWDRAVGPMQFIPETWSRWGADGDGDGIADPNQIDDAALAAARYLCASGPMTSVEGWRAAVFSYNHLDEYVDAVAAAANQYAAWAEGAG